MNDRTTPDLLFSPRRYPQRLGLLALLLCLILGLGAGCPSPRDDDDSAGDDDDVTDDDDASDDDDTSGDDEDCLGDYEPTFDQDACLDWEGASGLCGAQTDNPVCDVAVGCGIVSDFSQCTIDCTMMTTVSCIDDVTVQCVRDAACAEDCEALTACGYFF